MPGRRVIQTGEGLEGLAEAIEAGVLNADAARMYREVVNECKSLRAEVQALRTYIGKLEAINSEYLEMQIRALEEMMRKGKR